VEADAETGGAVEEDLMEDGAADAASGSLREGGLRGDGVTGRRVAEEADAAQDMVFGLAQGSIEVGEADGGEGLERVGHEAFAAGFIDGGLHGVDDFDVKTLTRGGDGTGESGWASADYQDIRSGPGNILCNGRSNVPCNVLAKVHWRLPFLPLEQDKL
jgi:hypothetical protein